MKLHRLTLAGFLLGGLAATASAQSPGVLYTWDHAFGAGAGPNVEQWSVGFGANAGTTTIDNATDGVLTITEGVAGGDWAITDGFNTISESAAPFAIGGLDLLGLDALEFDVSHNGTGDISGQIFLQPDNGTGCCGFLTSQFTISPGASTITVDLNALDGGPLPEADSKYVRAIGVQLYGNSEPAPITLTIDEIRSGGTPLTERVIADYTTNPSDLENVVVKFDNTGIAGSTGADNQDGLSLLGDALRWVDVANDAGGAVAWGNGNSLAVAFDSRTLDLSNYDFAEVTLRATAGAGADPTLGVQFYTQFINPLTSNEFDFAGASQTLPVDGTNHTLVFPLADLGADLSLTQWLGLNLDPHAGNMQIQVESVVLRTIPEPTALALLALAGVGAAARRR